MRIVECLLELPNLVASENGPTTAAHRSWDEWRMIVVALVVVNKLGFGFAQRARNLEPTGRNNERD